MKSSKETARLLNFLVSADIFIPRKGATFDEIIEIAGAHKFPVRIYSTELGHYIKILPREETR